MPPEKNQFTLYTPNPDPSKACPDYGKIQDGSHPGTTTEEYFGGRLAEERMITAAIGNGFEHIPILGDSSANRDVWSDHETREAIARTALEECVKCELVSTCPGASKLTIEAGIDSPFERGRRKLQLEIARNITSSIEGAVLKGGLAIALHGLDRTTDDLDFDISTPLSHTEKAKIQKIVEEYREDIEPKKDTETTLRYALPLSSNSDHKKKPMKVEFRTRDDANEEDYGDSTTVIDGIRVYTPDRLLVQKLRAFAGPHSRHKARDPVDISYILHHFPEAIDAVPQNILKEVSRKLRPRESKAEPEELLNTCAMDGPENMATLPIWLQESSVALRLLTELDDRIKDEVKARAAEA